mmetsp:Transcript_104456/g.164945  ORF Transcript_104456/g.164945 Transcript_104456/m.164945 type:complete len:237 (+) Transcript_104456:43-753(+)
MVAAPQLRWLLVVAAAAAGASVAHATAANVASTMKLVENRNAETADDPVNPEALDKVKQMIQHQIAVQKARLAKDTTEGDFCKREQAEVKDKLQRQSVVVKGKMDELEKAKLDDKKYLEGLEKDAKLQATEANRKLKEALDTAGLLQLRGERRSSRLAGKGVYPEERKTLEKVKFVKYELKHEVEALENLEKQRELLHNRCVAQVGIGMTVAERNAARDEEIQGLKDAYEILDDKD